MTAEEKSKGGLSFDILLSEASRERPQQPPPGEGCALTTHQIEEKLEQAEARRKKIEAERLASCSEVNSRVEETQRKRQAVREEFVTSLVDLMTVQGSDTDAVVERLSKLFEMMNKFAVTSENKSDVIKAVLDRL